MFSGTGMGPDDYGVSDVHFSLESDYDVDDCLKYVTKWKTYGKPHIFATNETY